MGLLLSLYVSVGLFPREREREKETERQGWREGKRERETGREGERKVHVVDSIISSVIMRFKKSRVYLLQPHLAAGHWCQ